MSRRFYILTGALFLMLGLSATIRATLIVNKTADTNDGFCTVSDCSLREAINAANNDISGGSLTLDTVVIQNNDSTSIAGSSGSHYFFGGTNHLITNSTFSGNTSGNCGAFDGQFAHQSDTITVINTTISGNSVLNAGGGLCVQSGTTKIRSSTISSNRAGGTTAGGGIFVFQSGIPATLDLGNTIVAGITGGSFPDFRYLGGTIITAGGNFIGNNSSVDLIFSVINTNFDRGGDAASPINPLLAPLAIYGGTTPTRALSNVSPAIDNGFNIFGQTPIMDQRGSGRVNAVDIGAFEFNPVYVGVLPIAIVNQPYNQIIPPNNNGFNYCISSGSLPPGISGIPNCFDPAAEGKELFLPDTIIAISGTPTISGTFNFAVTATGGTNSSTTNYQIAVTAPTAANVAVSGRVLDAYGNGISRASVTLTAPSGTIRYDSTNSFGYFRFENVAIGLTYIISVHHKRFQFGSQTTQILPVNDEVNDLIFNALPE